MNNKLNRYTLLAEGHDPILFEIGSAIGTKKMLCPWIKDIRPSKNDMRGSMTPLLKSNEKVIGEVYEILREWNLHEAPIGIDLLTVSMMQALVKFGMNVRDGQATMQEAQKIKTHEEIQLLEISAAMVDGAYYDVVEAIKPGVRENEVCACLLYTSRVLYKTSAWTELTCKKLSALILKSSPHRVSKIWSLPCIQMDFSPMITLVLCLLILSIIDLTCGRTNSNNMIRCDRCGISSPLMHSTSIISPALFSRSTICRSRPVCVFSS